MVLKTSISVLRDDYLYIANEQQVEMSIGRSIFHVRSHPEMVIYSVISGVGYLVLGEQVRKINTGEVVIVGAQQEHCFLKTLPGEQLSGQGELLMMYFNHPVFCQLFNKIPAYHQIGKMIENAELGLYIPGENGRRIIDQILCLRITTGFGRIMGVLRLLQDIALGPVTTILSRSIGVADATRNYYADSFVPIISMVHQHFLHPLTLSEIADSVGLRKNHICRLFKRRMQTTFTRYRDELRIQHAMKLLKSTDHSVKYISYHCGYRSTAHFCLLFKLIVGATPTSVREDKTGFR